MCSSRRHELPLRMTAVVVTKNGGREFTHLAKHLAWQRHRYGIDVLVVDSGSSDGTTTCAREHGFALHSIEPRDYGQRGRQRALSEFSVAQMADRTLAVYEAALSEPS